MSEYLIPTVQYSAAAVMSALDEAQTICNGSADRKMQVIGLVLSEASLLNEQDEPSIDAVTNTMTVLTEAQRTMLDFTPRDENAEDYGSVAMKVALAQRTLDSLAIEISEGRQDQIDDK